MANVRWAVDPMHSEVQFKVKHSVTEAGSVVVSDEIKLHAEIQLVKQAA